MCLVSCLCVPDRNILPAPSALVLFVADRFHPVNDLAVKLFLNGDVRHCGGWRGTMPVFLTWWESDHITRSNLLNRTSPALDPTTAGCYYERLAQWVTMPGSPGALLEPPATRAGPGASKRGSMRTVPVKYSAGPLPEGCEPLLLMSMFSIPPPCLQKQRGMFSV
jgi:hypothetical protein